MYKRQGFVRVLARPWGVVSVKGLDKPITTPRDTPVELEVGKQTLRVTNKFYQPMVKKIVIEEGTISEPRMLIFDFVKNGTPLESNEQDSETQKVTK